MLPKDKGGVVDTNLKVRYPVAWCAIATDPDQVYGTTNLRVVDLSVMPLEPATHTQCKSVGRLIEPC